MKAYQGLECIEIIRWLPGNLHSAFKYLWRKDQKGFPVKDLKKALWYVQDFRKHCGHNLMSSARISSLIGSLGWKVVDAEPDPLVKEAMRGVLRLAILPNTRCFNTVESAILQLIAREEATPQMELLENGEK